MGHSSYTMDLSHGDRFAVACSAASDEHMSHLQIITDSTFAYFILNESQLEQIHDVIQQRHTQIIARQTAEAQANNSRCCCIDYAGERANCPVHASEVLV